MVGNTTFAATEFLEAISNQGTVTEVTTPYIGLLTAVASDAGSVTEAAYASYAREAAAFNAPTGSQPVTISNSGTITFPVCTNSGTSVVETEIAFGLYDAGTSGHLITWDYLGGSEWFPFDCNQASPGTITCDGTTFTNGQQIALTTRFGGSLPTGLAQYTIYTVAGVSGNTFNVSTNTSSIGDGMLKLVVPQSIVPGSQPIISPGSLVIGS
jgi:hypothetical protein